MSEETQPQKPDPQPAISDSRLFLIVVGACLLAVVGFGGLLRLRKSGPAQLPDRPRVFGDFLLTDSRGRSVARGELNGKYCVVSFVFTSCGATCRLVSGQMAALQRLVKDQSDVRLVSLTVDPVTDTPEVLAKFSRDLGVVPEVWTFLTGPKSEITPLIESSFLPKDPTAGTTNTPVEFLYIERIALVDPRGNVRAYFNGLSPLTPRAILDEIDRLREDARRHR
jgi:cytochrome oxidase Cu insertion factor (SCO1/SenC/PrrC family)